MVVCPFRSFPPDKYEDMSRTHAVVAQQSCEAKKRSVPTPTKRSDPPGEAHGADVLALVRMCRQYRPLPAISDTHGRFPDLCVVASLCAVRIAKGPQQNKERTSNRHVPLSCTVHCATCQSSSSEKPSVSNAQMTFPRYVSSMIGHLKPSRNRAFVVNWQSASTGTRSSPLRVVVGHEGNHGIAVLRVLSRIR